MYNDNTEKTYNHKKSFDSRTERLAFKKIKILNADKLITESKSFYFVEFRVVCHSHYTNTKYGIK